jgi:hypothetical protein
MRITAVHYVLSLDYSISRLKYKPAWIQSYKKTSTLKKPQSRTELIRDANNHDVNGRGVVLIGTRIRLESDVSRPPPLRGPLG